jgi:hypothetical protein
LSGIDIPVTISAEVNDNATSKLEQIGLAISGILKRATEGAESGPGPAAAEPEAQDSQSKPGMVRWIDSAGEERYSQEGKSSGRRGRKRKGRGGGRQAAEVDPMEEVQDLIDEAIKLDSKREIYESQGLRVQHSRNREVEKQEARENKEVEKKHRREMNEWDRENKRITRQHEQGIERAGRMAGSLMGRAFWDIVQGRQGVFESMFKRGAQMGVQLMSEKLFTIFFKIGDEMLSKHFAGSELIKKGGEMVEKGLKKGAEFLIDGLKSVMQGIMKGISSVLSSGGGIGGGGGGGGGGPFGMISGAIGKIASLLPFHEGGILTAHGGLMIGGLDNNERLVKAKVGEWVINDSAAASLKRQNPNSFTMLNQGVMPQGQSGGVVVNAQVRDLTKAGIDRFVRTELNNALLRNRIRFRN